MYTTCYKWYDITINDMKYNLARIMHDMRTEKWEKIGYECKTKMESILGPHALCILMHWGIPLFHHDGMNAYTNRQGYDHYVLHNVAMTVSSSNGCLA